MLRYMQQGSELFLRKIKQRITIKAEDFQDLVKKGLEKPLETWHNKIDEKHSMKGNKA